MRHSYWISIFTVFLDESETKRPSTGSDMEDEQD